MIFNPEIVDYKFVMNNDPIEAVEFAAFYLYGLVEVWMSSKQARLSNCSLGKNLGSQLTPISAATISRHEKRCPCRRF